VIDRLLPIVASRWTRLVLVGLIVLGLQTTLFTDVRPFGVVAQLMLLLAVASGVTYGLEVGAMSGLLLGFMYDCVLNTPLGLCSLVFGGAGALAGALPFFIREPSWWPLRHVDGRTRRMGAPAHGARRPRRDGDQPGRRPARTRRQSLDAQGLAR